MQLLHAHAATTQRTLLRHRLRLVQVLALTVQRVVVTLFALLATAQLFASNGFSIRNVWDIVLKRAISFFLFHGAVKEISVNFVVYINARRSSWIWTG